MVSTSALRSFSKSVSVSGFQRKTTTGSAHTKKSAILERRLLFFNEIDTLTETIHMKKFIYNSKELVSWIEINLILSKLVGRMLALDSNCKVYINKNVCTALLSVVILDLSTTRLIKMYSYLCCCFHRENNLEYKGSGMTVSRIQSMCKKAREVAEAVRS